MPCIGISGAQDDVGSCVSNRLDGMNETKKKLPVFGFEVDVTEIPVVDPTENFTQYKLEDGTILKVKGVVTSVMRVDNQYLPDGNPVYIVYMSPVTSVISSPLRKLPTATAEGVAKKAN